VKLDNGERRTVEVERLVGSLHKATHLQVTSRDGKDHLISALDFFAQMNGESVSEAEIEEWNRTQFEVIQERTPGGVVLPSGIRRGY
jgi:hypothetical protein